MEEVGLREANIHFARYVKKVKDGEEILLTDRGKPVAVIKPITQREHPLDERLRRMKKEGLLSRSVSRRLQLHKLVSVKGKPLSEIVMESREERV